MSGTREERLPRGSALILILMCGCQGEPEGFARYVPAPSSARRAVEMALEDWRAGNPPRAIESVAPQVCVVDSLRPAGRRLERFEIVGEVPADNARGFVVRVVLEGEDTPQRARFLVVGIDPLWVYRQEDYESFSHWMHAMGEEKTAEK